MAGHTSSPCAKSAETHPGDYHRESSGSCRTRSDLLRTVELSGKQHSRLADPAQFRYESWLRKRASRELVTDQTPEGVGRAGTSSGPLGADQSSAFGRPETPGSPSRRASSY